MSSNDVPKESWRESLALIGSSSVKVDDDDFIEVLTEEDLKDEQQEKEERKRRVYAARQKIPIVESMAGIGQPWLSVFVSGCVGRVLEETDASVSDMKIKDNVPSSDVTHQTRLRLSSFLGTNIADALW